MMQIVKKIVDIRILQLCIAFKINSDVINVMPRCCVQLFLFYVLFYYHDMCSVEV
jgi:hypothetical protein